MNKVSPRSLSRKCIEVVYVDHSFLNKIFLYHEVDSGTRCTSCCSVPDKSLTSAEYTYKACSLSLCWQSVAVIGDHGFNQRAFTAHTMSSDIDLCLFLSLQHNKSVLEAKQVVIRNIFPRVLDDNSKMLHFLP